MHGSIDRVSCVTTLHRPRLSAEVDQNQNGVQMNASSRGVRTLEFGVCTGLSGKLTQKARASQSAHRTE